MRESTAEYCCCRVQSTHSIKLKIVATTKPNNNKNNQITFIRFMLHLSFSHCCCKQNTNQKNMEIKHNENALIEVFLSFQHCAQYVFTGAVEGFVN